MKKKKNLERWTIFIEFSFLNFWIIPRLFKHFLKINFLWSLFRQDIHYKSSLNIIYTRIFLTNFWLFFVDIILNAFLTDITALIVDIWKIIWYVKYINIINSCNEYNNNIKVFKFILRSLVDITPCSPIMSKVFLSL